MAEAVHYRDGSASGINADGLYMEQQEATLQLHGDTFGTCSGSRL